MGPMSHEHAPDHDNSQMNTAEFWDERYAGSDRVWSGNPNPWLVEHVAGLAPGAALDIGCGEGADVVWLAERGWQVIGLDVSEVALDRAGAHAAEAGVADRTSWLRADLMAGDRLPRGLDLVSVQFMHLPEDEFRRVFVAIGESVRPGGSLLVVGHHPADAATGLRNAHLSHLLFAPEQLIDVLDPGSWDILVADTPTRETSGRDGDPVTATDTVVLAVRR